MVCQRAVTQPPPQKKSRYLRRDELTSKHEHNQNNYGLSITVPGIDILLECGASILRVTAQVCQDLLATNQDTPSVASDTGNENPSAHTTKAYDPYDHLFALSA